MKISHKYFAPARDQGFFRTMFNLLFGRQEATKSNSGEACHCGSRNKVIDSTCSDCHLNTW